MDFDIHTCLCSVSKSVTYQLLKPRLDVVLFEIIFPLMCFNDTDDRLWREDPHEYVRKGYGMCTCASLPGSLFLVHCSVHVLVAYLFLMGLVLSNNSGFKVQLLNIYCRVFVRIIILDFKIGNFFLCFLQTLLKICIALAQQQSISFLSLSGSGEKRIYTIF